MDAAFGHREKRSKRGGSFPCVPFMSSRGRMMEHSGGRGISHVMERMKRMGNHMSCSVSWSRITCAHVMEPARATSCDWGSFLVVVAVGCFVLAGSKRFVASCLLMCGTSESPKPP